MKARLKHEGEPSIIDGRARLGAVKTPHAVRPRRRRAHGLDGAEDEPRTAAMDGRRGLWPAAVDTPLLRTHDGDLPMYDAPSITVTIGHQTRIFHAFVTSAPVALDAPATLTLCASSSADLAAFAADDMREPELAQSPARLVLVDAMELMWQRRRWREAGHQLLPADAHLAGLTTLQGWLWGRLRSQ